MGELDVGRSNLASQPFSTLMGATTAKLGKP